MWSRDSLTTENRELLNNRDIDIGLQVFHSLAFFLWTCNPRCQDQRWLPGCKNYGSEERLEGHWNSYRAATGWLLVPFSLDLGLDIEKSVINRSYARLWDRPGITFLSFAIFFPVFLVDRKWYWKDCYSWCLIPVRSCKRKDKENKSKIAKETVLSPAFLRFLVFAGHFSVWRHQGRCCCYWESNVVPAANNRPVVTLLSLNLAGET